VKCWHYSAETLQDIAQSVTDSSGNCHNIPQLVQDEECPVKLYEFIKPISALTTYRHFRADKESPGIVFVKEYCDSGKGIQIASETSSHRLVYAI
jgi:hypothetical protein